MARSPDDATVRIVGYYIDLNHSRWKWEAMLADIMADTFDVQAGCDDPRIKAVARLLRARDTKWLKRDYPTTESRVELAQLVEDELRRQIEMSMSSPSDPQQPQVIELRWAGPFDLVSGGALPIVSHQAVARNPGVYLWTIRVGKDFHINYIGKTDRSFSIRLEEEIVYEREEAYKYFDVEAFAQGKRVPIARPRDPHEARANTDQMLAMTRIFVAPLVVPSALLSAIERELIHHVQCASPERREFLANGPAYPSGLPLKLVSFSSVQLVGLENLRDPPVQRVAPAAS